MGTGVYWMKFLVTLEIRSAGMTLSGNGRPARGSRMTPPGRVEVKPFRLPASCAGVGTLALRVLFWRLRSFSKSPKKNSLFFRMGPPAVKPNWFCLKGTCFWPK